MDFWSNISCHFTQSLHFPEHHHDLNLEFFATPMFMRNLRHFSHDEPPASNPQICSSIPLCSFTWIWYKTCSDCEKLCHPIQCENNQTNMREKIMLIVFRLVHADFYCSTHVFWEKTCVVALLVGFWIPIIFSNLDSNVFELRNLQEQV